MPEHIVLGIAAWQTVVSGGGAGLYPGQRDHVWGQVSGCGAMLVDKLRYKHQHTATSPKPSDSAQISRLRKRMCKEGQDSCQDQQQHMDQHTHAHAYMQNVQGSDSVNKTRLSLPRSQRDALVI